MLLSDSTKIKNHALESNAESLKVYILSIRDKCFSYLLSDGEVYSCDYMSDYHRGG